VERDLSAVQDWWEDNCLRLAISLAYDTGLSLAPLLLLIAGVVGLVLGREQVASQLAAQLESLMGPSSRELMNSILVTISPEGGTLATILGLVTLSRGQTTCGRAADFCSVSPQVLGTTLAVRVCTYVR
jgi:membrane protein